MQRKATSQSRGPNAKEKALQAWVKYQPCSFCGSLMGSEVDHAVGSTYKKNKLLIGHVFVNSKCRTCHEIVTQDARSGLFKLYGITDSDATLTQLELYESEKGIAFDEEILNAIGDVYFYYKANEDTTNEWLTKL